MAFVDDDDAESILAVVFREKTGEVGLIVVQSQGLVSGDVNASVLCRIFALFRFYNPGIVAEDGFEFRVRLPTQFVAVAEE